MAKFKIGDKVRVTKGKWEGYVGTVTQITEASEELDTEEWCMIHVPERGACEMDFKAEMLEYAECTKDNNVQLFESFLPHQEYSKSWNEIMESESRDLYLAEMAEIYVKYIQEQRPKIKFHVCVVQGGEGPVPHVHVYFGDKGDKSAGVAYVCLATAEYAPQHKDGMRLNSKQKEELIVFFNTMRKGAASTDKDGNLVPCNCWREAVDLWKSSYELPEQDPFTYDENGEPVMPDYRDL